MNRERENNHIQKRMWENNKNFIENNIRRKKVKTKNIAGNTKLSKSSYVM